LPDVLLADEGRNAPEIVWRYDGADRIAGFRWMAWRD
jgi:hypothetical protein